MNESLQGFKEWLEEKEQQLREQQAPDRERERVAAALNLLDEYLGRR